MNHPRIELGEKQSLGMFHGYNTNVHNVTCHEFFLKNLIVIKIMLIELDYELEISIASQ